MDTTNQTGGGGGDAYLSSSSSSQIFDILISDFLSPLKLSYNNNKTSNNKKEDLILQQKLISSGNTLLTIVRNALRSHQSEKFRKVRLSNPKIQKMVVTVPYAVDLLTAVGFVYAEIDGDKFLMFSENEQNSLYRANLFCSTMEEELKKLEPPPFPVGIHSDSSPTKATAKETTATTSSTTSAGETTKKTKSNDGDTLFLSDQERKERMMKVKKAKLAKKFQKDLAIKRWAEDKMERENRENKRKKKEANKGIGKNDAEAMMDIISSKNIKIRKLDEQTTSPSSKKAPPAPSTSSDIGGDPNESLESIRAKAADAWNKKHKPNNHSISNNNNKSESDNDNDEDGDSVMLSSNDPDVKDGSNAKYSSMDVEEEDDETNLKPAAVQKSCLSQEVFDPIVLPDEINNTQPSWEESLESIPRCRSASGIRETSVFNTGLQQAAHSSSSTHTCLKRLFSEFEDLKTSLPSDKRCSAWLRFDEETPQYIRAILPAPLPGPSPYSGGVFAFDIMIPDNYPNDPPKVQIITTGRGKVRFGPNLYACGKVCLSLIGTWSGPKWNPKASSLFQVLVSIQSLILGVEHPFFLEPGHGGWEEKIKEGEFTSVGNTLSGETVKEDLTLPSHAWVYEDQIRVATLRYAMLEPLTLVLKKNSTSNPALAHLLPFKDIMHLHFFHNGADTLQAVADWINASRPSTIGSRYKNDPSAPPSRQRDGSTKPYPIEFVNSMDTLYDQLEGLLKKLPPSSTLLNEETESNQSGDESMKPPPAENIDVSKETDLLDRRMKEAAESGNFILAGQIQKEIQEVESFDQKVADLNRQIQEAASKGDYVTAGELQANLKTFQSKAMNVASGSTSAQQMYPEDDEEMESAEDQFSDGDDSYDDGYDNDNYHRNKWGTGQRLNEITSQTSGSKDDAPAKISVSRLPVKDSRRLRIRLPSNSSIIEEFDGEEKLRTIYQVIKSHLPTKDTKKQHLARAKVVQVRGFSDALGNQKVGLCGGAFAAPLSEFGFTLLSAHPKREYSIEMDGLRTLKDLQIHTSAALTVMRCDERGMSLRGDLESKLAEAQGDAMDVDDLNYEALQELGEKIGVAAPGDGIKGLDQADLERISTLLSPNEFLSQKTTGDDDHDSRCCICLGEFDPDDTNKSLRILNHCGHCMHDSCLQTWLSTKTSCPVCKHSLND